MKEFAGRTHQSARHDLARDYIAPEIQLAAVPVRIERRRTATGISYRIVGIVWGGRQKVDRLAIRFGIDGPWTPFPVCGASGPSGTWSLWEFQWRPAKPGTYRIFLSAPDQSIPQRRLDSGYYMREVTIS
jgi:hypothetical protein